MANTTGWISGRGVGLPWSSTNPFGAEIGTLVAAATVLSTVDITNATFLDQYADVSIIAAISSATPPAGAFLALYLFSQLADGATYGDNSLTPAGTAKTSFAPATAPIATFPIAPVTTTVLSGAAQLILLPPGIFRFAVYNNSGSNFTSCAVRYRTYNVNLNN